MESVRPPSFFTSDTAARRVHIPVGTGCVSYYCGKLNVILIGVYPDGTTYCTVQYTVKHRPTVRSLKESILRTAHRGLQRAYSRSLRRYMDGLQHCRQEYSCVERSRVVRYERLAGTLIWRPVFCSSWMSNGTQWPYTKRRGRDKKQWDNYSRACIAG